MFSVSQVETFDLCPRKWALQKIDGLETPPNKFAVLGDKCHDVLERYLKKGIPVDPHTEVGRIVFPGLKYLPLPMTPGMRVEEWFSFEFGVAAYRGLKDVEILKPKNSRYPLVLDHKTTRNFAWMKTEERLITDTQAGLYSAHCMQLTGEDAVDLHWQYYKTEGKPHSEPVKARISRNQVGDVLTRVNHTAEKMVRTLQMYGKGRAIEVTPDFTACQAYGGCAFKEKHCKPRPQQILKAIMSQKVEEEKRSTSDFLEKIRKRKDKKGGESERVEVEDTRATKDKGRDTVNSPDRESFEPPPPPPPKKFDGKWVQAEWDDADAEWKFPEEVEKAEKAAAKAAEKAEDKESKEEGGKKSSRFLASKKDKSSAKAEAAKNKPKEEPKPIEPEDDDSVDGAEVEAAVAAEERQAIELEPSLMLVSAVSQLAQAIADEAFRLLQDRLKK